MEEQEILDLVVSYFSGNFEIPKDQIEPGSSLRDDLGLDSIDALDMSAMLESELDIEVKEGELEQFRTVQDVINYIKLNSN